MSQQPASKYAFPKGSGQAICAGIMGNQDINKDIQNRKVQPVYHAPLPPKQNIILVRLTETSFTRQNP